MAHVALAIRQRERPGMQQQRTFTINYGPSARQRWEIRGVTFDGTYLWFSTTFQSIVPTTSPRLLQVDPQKGTLVNVVQTTVPNTQNLLDIAWNGDGFYGLTAETPNPFAQGHVHLIDITGQIRVPDLVAGLPNDVRGICTDGYYFYITYLQTSPTSITRIAKYEPRGNRVFDTAGFTVGTGQASGIVHDGYFLLEKPDPVLNFTRLYYTIPPKLVTATKLYNLGADNSSEQAPCAFDGYYVWEFDSTWVP